MSAAEVYVLGLVVLLWAGILAAQGTLNSRVSALLTALAALAAAAVIGHRIFV